MSRKLVVCCRQNTHESMSLPVLHIPFLSADKAEKQATVYGAACMDKAKMIQEAEESSGLVQESHWTDEDIAFNLGLESWDEGAGNVPEPVVPRRIFNAWIEEWEWDCIHDRDSVSEARLLQKYQGLMWIDPDQVDDSDTYELNTAEDTNMEYQGGRDSPGWCVIGTRFGDGGMEPWPINVVIDLIAIYVQPVELNVEVVVNPIMRAANEQRWIDEEQKRKRNGRKKK